MALLQNIFVKSIVVPIVLAIAAALLQSVSALVKGKTKGPYKYRVWIKQQQPDKSVVTVPLMGQSLQAIRDPINNSIIGIEPMVDFDIANFGALGIDLIIGAFAVDITSLIGPASNPTIVGYVLIGHVFMLIGIILFLMLSDLTPPEEQTDKRNKVKVAITLGLLAMMMAFFTVR